MRKLRYLKLRNIMGLGVDGGEVEFELGKLNIVKGSNGAGKTRLIKSLQLLFSDRVKTDYLRTDNQGEGEIIAIFDDGSKLQLTAKENGVKRQFVDSEGIPIPVRNFIKDTVSEFALDPAKFLDPKGWDYRIKSVVNALNIQISKEQWQEIFQNDIPTGFPFDNTAIEQIEFAEKYLSERRRNVGAVRNDHKGTLESLKSDVSNVSDIDIDAELATVREKIEQTIAERYQVANDIKSKHQQEINEVENEISELEKRLEVARNKRQEIDRIIESETKEKSVKIEVALGDLRVKEQEFLNLQREQANLKTKLAIIKETEEKYIKYDKLYKELDNTIKQVRQLQKNVLDECAIKGLSVTKKDIEINGYPFEVVNTAEKVRVFLEIARLTLKDCPIILFDNFESIGDGIRNELVKQLIEQDIQVVFAELDPREDSPLTILAK